MGAEEIIVIAIAVVFVLLVVARQVAVKIKAKKSGKPLPVESLIAKEILPIRPNRSNIRDLKHKGVVCFNYRFD